MKPVLTLVLLLLSFAVTHAQSGTLDNSFDNSGKILDKSIWADCEAMALQPGNYWLNILHDGTVTTLPFEKE